MKVLRYLFAFIIINTSAFSQTTVVMVPTISALPGQKIVIPINVTNFNNIGAVSFKIKYDSAVVHFDSSSRRAEFISNASAGIIGIGRADVNPVIPDNGNLLDLYFTYLGDSTILEFKTSDCELATVDGNIISNVTYKNGRITLNHSPVFTHTLPDTMIFRYQDLTFDYDAVDPDGDVIKYFLVQNIPGAKVDSITGIFTWEVDFNNLPSGLVIMGATDGSFIIKDTAIVLFDDTNYPPLFITTMPDQNNIPVGDTISFHYTAADPYGDSTKLRFRLVNPPAGALIDSASGQFRFITQAAGTFKIIVSVTDQTYFRNDTSIVTVISTNHPPFFVHPLPDTTIYEGDTLDLNIAVSDPDGNENLRISLVNPPPIVRVNQLTWHITISPGYEQAGVYKIILALTDQVVTVYDTSIVTVLNKNRPPVFTSVMLDPGIYGPDTIIFDYDAIDPDGDSVRYSLLQNVSGAVIDSLTGIFTYIIDIHAIPAIIIVGASDGELMTADTAWTYVDILNRIPYFINTMSDQLNHEVGDTIIFHYTAGDSEGVADLRFGLYNPLPGATIDSVSGLFRFITPYIGSFAIIVTLTDQIVTVYDTAWVNVVTGIKREFGIPSDYALLQNYPNPFNPITTIRFSLPKESFVTLTIYNLIGQNVAALVNEVLPAAYHEYNFNASNLTSGIYIYKLQAGEFITTRKMTLLK